MQDDYLQKFFSETIDDTIEKKIIETILQELDEEALIDILLRKNKNVPKKRKKLNSGEIRK